MRNKNHIVLGVFLSLALNFNALALEWMSCPNAVPSAFSNVLLLKPNVSQSNAASGRKFLTPVTCVDIDRIGSVIQKLGQMASSLYPATQGPVLDFNPLEGNAYSAGRYYLHLPRELTIEDIAKNPVWTYPVWAHEFGHSIFLRVMAQKRQEYADEITKIESIIELKLKADVSRAQLQEIEAKIEALNKKPQTPQILAEIQKLEAQRSEKSMESQGLGFQVMILSMGANIPHYRKMGPYTELFGDLAAVLYTGHPDIISKALSRTKLIQEHKLPLCVSCRSFSAKENDLSRWVRLQKMGKTLPTEAHDVLAPSRYYLWTRYLSAGSFRNSPSEVMARYLNAVDFALMNSTLDESDPAYAIKINQEFMSALDAEFSK